MLTPVTPIGLSLINVNSLKQGDGSQVVSLEGLPKNHHNTSVISTYMGGEFLVSDRFLSVL